MLLARLPFTAARLARQPLLCSWSRAMDAAQDASTRRFLFIERVAADGTEQAGPSGAQQQQQQQQQRQGTDSGVRVLHLNKPESLNSLTTAMAAEFEEAMAELRQDAGARVLVVTGEGRAFSAGGDFAFLEERISSNAAENATALFDFYRTFLQIRQLPMPVIAAINGPAVGGGMCFALAADIRLASTAARLSFNFVKLGISPGMGATFLLPRATSHQVACRLLLTGDLITGEEAKQLGLVLDVVAPTQLLPMALELAGRIAAASPTAVAATLQLLRSQQAAAPWEELVHAAAEEARVQGQTFVQPDIREGLAAVKEKRPPRFGMPQANSSANGNV